jgi:hypothetical protein
MSHSYHTLFRPPTAELQILSWSRQLKPIRLNEYSALRFLSNALRTMRIARAPDCLPIDQLSSAYSSIYSLCLGSLYLHGMLPSGNSGYDAVAIQLGSELLRLTPRERDKILSTCIYLQLMVGDFPEEVEAVVSKDVLALGEHTLRQARKVFPDWFD